MGQKKKKKKTIIRDWRLFFRPGNTLAICKFHCFHCVLSFIRRFESFKFSSSSRKKMQIRIIFFILFSFLLIHFMASRRARPSWRYIFHDLSRLAFQYNLNCSGEYDRGILAEMYKICNECYDQYRHPEINSLCRYVNNKIANL